MAEKVFISYLNDLMNFNEIFRKDVTYANIKSHKKPEFHTPFKGYIFEKNHRGGVNLTPSLFRVNLLYSP